MKKRFPISAMQALRFIILGIVFLSLTCLLYLGFRQDAQLTEGAQQITFSLGLGALLAGLATLLLSIQMGDVPPRPKRWWFYPLVSGLLGLGCMSLAYVYLGVWPVGERSVMTVDMHHQYAPLLAQLRHMLIHGGSPLYSFEVGLGASFIPLFGYYLASPFNLLLVLFPPDFLNEGILIITLLKNALTAGFFALCVQYIYRRRDMSIVIVSLLYSMMMYLLAYSWNLMWLDCVMVLPLVVMSLEKLMRSGKYLPYVLSLAYALYANYYIGFMICLFMVLYFLFYLVRQEYSSRIRMRNLGRFSVGSLLGGGLAMFLLIPVYFSLSHTSAAGGSLPDMKNNFNMLGLLGQHLYQSTPTIRSGNLPNIYAGILPVMLVPVFATIRTIPLRRRLAWLGLLGTMGASLLLSQPDILWHGLHAPNDLPYRFSFLYSFVLILIAYETLLRLRDITLRQVAVTLAGVAGWLVLMEQVGGEAMTFPAIYVSLLLAFIYALVLGLVLRRRLAVRAAYTLLLLVVTAEMTLNAGASFRAIQSKEYFTARHDYVANDITRTLYKAVDRTEEIGDAAAGGAFYRMEFLPRRTTVDTALFDYRGMTVFASSSPQKLTKFMGYIGYAVNGVNSHLYKSFTPVTDALLGIRYVILNAHLSDELSGDPYLTYHDQVQEGDTTYSIYENTAALPLGYLVDGDVRNWTPSQYDPITSQNALYTSLTGEYIDLYTLASLEADSQSGDFASTLGGTSFSISGGEDVQTAEFTAEIAKTGQVYAFIDCRAAESARISSAGNTWDASAREPHMTHIGRIEQGETVTISVSAKGSVSGNIYVCTLNADVFDSALETLRETPFKVSSFDDTCLSGTVDATRNGVLFTTIPYDEGWTVRVDGEIVETFAAGEAMLAFDVGMGVHEVEIRFSTTGLLPGAAVSLVSLMLLILLLVFIGKRVDGKDPSDDEFAAFARLFSRRRKDAEPPIDWEENPVYLSEGTEVPYSSPEIRVEEESQPIAPPLEGEDIVDNHPDAGL